MHPPRLCAPGDERRERERVSECAEVRTWTDGRRVAWGHVTSRTEHS